MNVKPSRKRIQVSENNAPTILVVEDEEDNLLFISHALIFLKHNFITATDGETAFNLATNYQLDLVLLDLVLSDTNGFELVSRLKQEKSTQDMPIIAITALAREQDRDRALAAGCDDYLSKPYLIDDLERKIRHHLPQSFFSRIFLDMLTNIIKGLAILNPI